MPKTLLELTTLQPGCHDAHSSEDGLRRLDAKASRASQVQPFLRKPRLVLMVVLTPDLLKDPAGGIGENEGGQVRHSSDPVQQHEWSRLDVPYERGRAEHTFTVCGFAVLALSRLRPWRKKFRLYDSASAR